jgi:hypothetical protein
VPAPQESILTKKRQFLQLPYVMSYVPSGHLLFFTTLVVLLSERDIILLVVDGRSDLNSSSSG